MNLLKRTKKFLIIAFIFISVCAAAAIRFQQLRLTTIEAQSQPQLTLEISTPQHKYIQFEPIPLDFKLSNQTAVPITWNGLFMLGRDVNILARTANGNEFRWSIKGNNVDIFMETEVMQPDKNKVMQDLVDEEILERLFQQPGRYELRVEFNYLDVSSGQVQKVKVLSNPITIDVDEPKGNDRKAYDYFKKINEFPRYTGKYTKEELSLRQYFVDNFPDSPYWKYAVYDLAEIYFELNEYQKAEDEFYKISDIDFYHSKKVEKQLDKLASKLQRPMAKTKRKPKPDNMTPVFYPEKPYTPPPNSPPVELRIPIPIPNPTPK